MTQQRLLRPDPLVRCMKYPKSEVFFWPDRPKLRNNQTVGLFRVWKSPLTKLFDRLANLRIYYIP